MKISFYQIEDEIETKHLVAIIEALVNSNEKDRLRLLDVSDFLHNNSSAYTKLVQDANKRIEQHKRHIGFTWLKSCTENNNFAAFIMLLTHGLKLTSIVQLIEGQPNNATYNTSTAQFLFYESAANYAFTSIKNKSGQATIEQLFATKQNLNSLLRILLKPEYSNAIAYSDNTSSLQDRSVMTSLLDVALTFELPDEFLLAITENTSINGIHLFNLATNLGALAIKSSYTWVVNDDAANVICVPSIILPNALGNHINDCRINPSKVRIKPCFYFVINKQSLDNRLRSVEQLQQIHLVHQNLVSLIPGLVAKQGNLEFYSVIKQLLDQQRYRSNDRLTSISKKSNDAMGALILLCKIVPSQTYYNQHYTTLLEAILTFMRLNPHSAAGPLFAFEAKNLIRQAKSLEKIDLFIDLLKIIKQMGMMQAIKDLAAPVEKSVTEDTARYYPDLSRLCITKQ